MISRFILKLGRGGVLQQADEAILAELARTTRSLGSSQDIVRQGEATSLIPVLLDGWACRQRVLENGKRQITALYLPGDICEPFGGQLASSDSTLSTLTRATVAYVMPSAFKAAAQISPRIENALWQDMLIASSIDQERLVSVGRRSAAERLGHLFCELHQRLELVGLADTPEYDIPLIQAEISDLLGLTPVHVNRSLRSLREMGLISLQGRRLVIHDVKQLRQLSLFDPAYLHIGCAKGSEWMDLAGKRATR